MVSMTIAQIGGATCARFICALAAMLALGCVVVGCEKKSHDAGAVPVPLDEPQAEEVEQEPLPEFAVIIEADPVNGNAPLDVTFNAALAGDEVDPADLTWKWTLGQTVLSEERAFTHTFLFATTATVTLEAVYRRGLESYTATAETIVRVLGCADLTFDQVSLAPPLDVAPGDPVTLKSGRLRNDGDGIEMPFEIWLVLSEDDIFNKPSNWVL